MIITNSDEHQDVANCDCPCFYDPCDISPYCLPSIEYGSVHYYGWKLPYIAECGNESACDVLYTQKYESRTVTNDFSSTYVINEYGWLRTDTSYTVEFSSQTTTRPDLTVNSAVWSCEYDYHNSSHSSIPDDGYGYNQETYKVSTRTTEGVCSGEQWKVTTGSEELDPDDPPIPFNVCPCNSNIPTVLDEDWGCGPSYSFSESETTSGDDWERTVTIDYEIIYSVPLVIPAIFPEGKPTVGATSSYACDTDISVVGRITIARYRWKVPPNYSTEEKPRSVYEMQWDEMTASPEWWAWWDGGRTGTEPSPAPVLVEKEWVWGGDMEDPYSPWYVMAVPPMLHTTRRFNILITTYHSSRIGMKPKAYGPSYSPPAP